MKLYDSLVSYGLLIEPDADLLDRLAAHYSLATDRRDTPNFYYLLAAGQAFQWFFEWLKQYGEPDIGNPYFGMRGESYPAACSYVRGVSVPDWLIAVNDPTCSQRVLDSLPSLTSAQHARLPVCYDLSSHRLWVRIRFEPAWYCARGAPTGLSLLAAVAYLVEERLREVG